MTSLLFQAQGVWVAGAGPGTHGAEMPTWNPPQETLGGARGAWAIGQATFYPVAVYMKLTQNSVE